jgi:hypothetical protein
MEKMKKKLVEGKYESVSWKSNGEGGIGGIEELMTYIAMMATAKQAVWRRQAV